MIRVRVSYDHDSEKREALALTYFLAKILSKRYKVYVSKKYRNRHTAGGRIYMNLKEKHLKTYKSGMSKQPHSR